jgi:hypothetical protein
MNFTDEELNKIFYNVNRYDLCYYENIDDQTFEKIIYLSNKYDYFIFNYSNLARSSNGSENLIRKYSDEFSSNDWRNISERKNLSLKFIQDFEDKIDFHYLTVNSNLTEDIIRKYYYKLNIDVIINHYYKFKNLTPEFINLLKVWQ